MNSGTEAVMAAVKAARAFTGRPKIAKIEGAYHGTYDYVEISQTPGPDRWGPHDQPNAVPLAAGTPQGVADDVVIIPFNDSDIAIQILDRHGASIAGVLIDPIPHRVGLIPADLAFVRHLRDWALGRFVDGLLNQRIMVTNTGTGMLSTVMEDAQITRLTEGILTTLRRRV